MQIKIIPNEKGNPPGKLAEAELYFGDGDGPLAGLKLIGFSIWESRTGSRRNVTFPARQYSVNGERRSFALLRPIGVFGAQDGSNAQIREAILDAYTAYEEHGITEKADAIVNKIGKPYEPVTTTSGADDPTF